MGYAELKKLNYVCKNVKKMKRPLTNWEKYLQQIENNRTTILNE